MTDTNKKAFIQIYDDRDSDYAIFTDGWNAAVKSVFLGDRVGQTFEDWFDKNSHLVGYKTYDICKEDMKKVWVAATLQPQQTMGREELIAKLSNHVKAIGSRLQLGILEEDLGDVADALLGKLPAPSHPGEGELTRGRVIDFVKAGDHHDLWFSIVQARAATEARVRAQEQESVLRWMGEVDSLRSTIADLKANMETSVQIDWLKAPAWVKEAKIMWQGHADDGSDYGCEESHHRRIPRPTPKTLTNQEKAEAVMHAAFLRENILTMEGARDWLFDQFVSGKTIDELYAEVKGE
jgi:hypothetical protein